MEAHVDPKRVVAEAYDRMGPAFDAWNSRRPPAVRTWFLGEVLARLGAGSTVLELGCGPGTDADALSTARRYIGVDVSAAQLSIARRRVSSATFVRGDLTSIAFRPGSLDGVVAFYVFMHVPQQDLAPTFERIATWLRPGGHLMLSISTFEDVDRVEEWLDVPTYFARFTPGLTERLIEQAGFSIVLSELRDEVDDRYGPTDFRWIIARSGVGR